MCLAVPGKITDAPNSDGDADVGNTATVDFQGTRTEVSLALTPQARLGDWVLVHAGFALQVLDEEQALDTWRYLDRMGLVGPPESREPVAEPSLGQALERTPPSKLGGSLNGQGGT